MGGSYTEDDTKKEELIHNVLENKVDVDSSENLSHRDVHHVGNPQAVDIPELDENISNSCIISEDNGGTDKYNDDEGVEGKLDINNAFNAAGIKHNSFEESIENKEINMSNEDDQSPLASLEEIGENISKSYIVSENNTITTVVDGEKILLESPRLLEDSNVEIDQFKSNGTNYRGNQECNDLFVDIGELDVSKSYVVSENSRAPVLSKFSPVKVKSIDLDKNVCKSGDYECSELPAGNNYMDELSPPTDSLRSIKSIAEKRKKKIIENSEIQEREKIANNSKKNLGGNNRYKPKSAPVISKPFLKKNEGRLSSNLMKKNSPDVRSPMKKIPVTKLPQRDHDRTPSMNILKSDSVKNKLELGKENVEIEQLHLLNEKERKKNLRICQNLMSSQKKWKLEKEKLCIEYENKIESLKEKLNSEKEGHFQHSKFNENSPDIGSDISYESLQNQLRLQESLLKGFQQENERLYNDLKQQDDLKQEVESMLNCEKQELLQQIETLKMIHQVDNEKLQNKLKWYAENQLLLDRDEAELKSKRDEVKDLHTIVERLEAEVTKMKHHNTELKKELNSRPTKTLPYESPIRDTSKNRSLDIIPSILVPTEKKQGESVIEQKDVNLYLEKRVKSLEKELEEKDCDSAKKIRAIEQKYIVLNMEYEQNMQQLKTKLDTLTAEKDLQSNCDIDAAVASIKNECNIMVEGLQKQIEGKKKELVAVQLEWEEKSKNNNEKLLKANSTLQKQADKLKQKLKAKDKQINELAATILQLRNDRFLLTEELQGSLAEKELNFLPDQNTRLRKTKPLDEHIDLSDMYSTLLEDNKSLQNRINELNLLLKEKQLMYKALEVKTESEIGNLKEKDDNEKIKIEQKYKLEIEKLKMQFVVDHSNSKVAELNGTIQGYEQMINHLKSNLDDTRADQYKLRQLKLSEDTLKKKISGLQKDLFEARKLDTPELHHYRMLEAKINGMEKSHHSREEKLESIIEEMKIKANKDVETIEEKWRKILHRKDDEIQKFKVELDNIIEVLEELQRQGLEIPNFDVGVSSG